MELSLGDIRDRIVSCTLCDLRSTCERPVPGYGPPDANIFVVGEAPGYYEEKNGRPFVGAAGKLLTELFSSIGMSRKEVYFANTVNCRPPNNRDPKQTELDACRNWIFEQLNRVDPKIVLTLGRFSTKTFFPPSNITTIHGSARYDGKRVYMAMYHPAAALHDPTKKSAIEEDFQKLREIILDMNLN